MKKTIYCLALGIMTLTYLSSCKKKSTSTNNNNNTTTETIEVEVPITKTKTLTDSLPNIPAPIPYPGLGLMKDTFATKVDEMLATFAPGVTKDKIISITPTYFKADIDDSTGQSFDFIDDSVNVYLSKYLDPTEVKVASAHGIQKGSKSITFNCESTDVKDLFYNDFLQFTLKFGSPANSSMKKNSVFITSIKFKIKAYKP